MSLEKYMDAYLGFIRSRDAELLGSFSYNCSNPIPAVYEYEEGFFVHCGESSFCDPGYEQSLIDFGYSKEFIVLLKFASALGCWFLRLDRDGDSCYDFPTFEW